MVMIDEYSGLSPKEFYASSNLKGNPFRQNPLFDTDPRAGIWVGYEEERNDFLGLLNQSRSDFIGSSNLILLYGELGAGKTHALMWARHQILTERKEAFNSVVYQIGSLRNDDKITFAATFERDIVNKSNIILDVAGFRQHLDELCVEYRKTHSALTKDEIIEQIIPSRELASLAKEIIHAETEDAIRRMLVPQKLGEFGTVGRFASLINLFVLDITVGDVERSWKKAAYLLVDEMNLLVDASAKEQRMANEIIRNLYDSCPNRFGFVLAFTASVAQVSLLFDEWVLSRVSKQIVMQTLPQQEAKDFVAGILKHDRVNTPEANPFRPFDEDAVDSIVSQMSSITPRRIMKTMERMLELVRAAGLDPKKELATATFLDDNGLTDEISSVPL
jgi:hypothetical protein